MLRYENYKTTKNSFQKENYFDSFCLMVTLWQIRTVSDAIRMGTYCLTTDKEVI